MPSRMSLPPLSPEQMVKPRRFELRMALIYATLFVPVGVNLPYFPLWLEKNGFDARQIAVVLSAPMFLQVITTPFIAALADRVNDRAHILIAAVACTVGISPAISSSRPICGCWWCRWHWRSCGRRTRPSPIRWRCRACAVSARTIPECACGARSRF